MDYISKTHKRCPRCDKKMPITEAKCPRCGLVFSRLSKATNAAAKRAYKRREKDKVIYDKVLPKDVNKWKLLCMCIFLGLFGGHYFYIGRIWRGLIMLGAFVLVAIVAAFPLHYWAVPVWEAIFSIAILPIAITFLLWIWDIFRIIFNKFPVPISIDEIFVEVDDAK